MDQFLQSLYQQFDLLLTQKELLQQNIQGISDLILLNGGTIPVHEKSNIMISKQDELANKLTSSHEQFKQSLSSSHEANMIDKTSHGITQATVISSHESESDSISSHKMEINARTSSLEVPLINKSSHEEPLSFDVSSHEVISSMPVDVEVLQQTALEKVTPIIPDLFSQAAPLPPHTTYEAFMAMQAMEKTPQQDLHDLRNNPTPPYTEDYDNRPVPAMYQVPKEYNEKMMWTEKILYALNELRLPATAHQVASAIHELEPDSNLSIEKSVELTTSRMFKNKIINAKKEKNKNYYYLYYYSK